MSDGLLGFWPQKDRSLRSEPLGCFGRGRQGLTARLLNRTFALTNRLEHVLRTSGSIDLVKELSRAGAYLPMHCACVPYLSIDAQKRRRGQRIGKAEAPLRWELSMDCLGGCLTYLACGSLPAPESFSILPSPCSVRGTTQRSTEDWFSCEHIRPKGTMAHVRFDLIE